VPGVVAARYQRRKRLEPRKTIDYEDLYLDVGAADGEELRGLLRPGDAVVWHGAPLALRGERMASRSFDNRIGCYVALEAARRIAERGGGPGDVIAVAAVQEEVGDFAGSRTTAFATEPEVALAIDVTHATDIRGGDHDDEGKIVLGSGATLTRGPPLHPGVFELLHDVAEAEGIPFSVEVSRGTTWTDADAVYLSRRGVPTGLVSVPLRYMHSPIETVDLDDIEQAVRLIVAFAGRLEPGLSFAG
jgi:endoglucanase